LNAITEYRLMWHWLLPQLQHTFQLTDLRPARR
jgi:hypothetical protein